MVMWYPTESLSLSLLSDVSSSLSQCVQGIILTCCSNLTFIHIYMQMVLLHHGCRPVPLCPRPVGPMCQSVRPGTVGNRSACFCHCRDVRVGFGGVLGSSVALLDASVFIFCFDFSGSLVDGEPCQQETDQSSICLKPCLHG